MVFVWTEFIAMDDWVQITKKQARWLISDIGPDDTPERYGAINSTFGVVDICAGGTCIFLGVQPD